MRYLLHTNVCVMYLNGRSNAVRDRLMSTQIEDMAVCSVVKSEARIFRAICVTSF